MKDAFDMIGADGPAPEAAVRDAPFSKLIGSWRIESVWFGPEGERRTATGEWHFRWILGGYGIQDVLFADDYPRERYGTTLRCWDRERGVWRVSWMQPGNGEFAELVGRVDGGQVVQELVGIEGRREVWRFAEIGADSFLWLSEVSADGGTTWSVTQEMRGTRFDASR